MSASAMLRVHDGYGPQVRDDGPGPAVAGQVRASGRVHASAGLGGPPADRRASEVARSRTLGSRDARRGA